MSSSAQRALRILKALKGRTLDGMSNAELAKALDESPVNISRACDDLIAEGLVQKLDTGRFAHSVAFLQIAHAHADAIQRAGARLAELQQRISIAR